MFVSAVVWKDADLSSVSVLKVFMGGQKEKWLTT